MFSLPPHTILALYCIEFDFSVLFFCSHFSYFVLLFLGFTVLKPNSRDTNASIIKTIKLEDSQQIKKRNKIVGF